jgi:hypothetical protein
LTTGNGIFPFEGQLSGSLGQAVRTCGNASRVRLPVVRSGLTTVNQVCRSDRRQSVQGENHTLHRRKAALCRYSRMLRLEQMLAIAELAKNVENQVGFC